MTYKPYKKTDSVAIKATFYTILALVGLAAIVALTVLTKGAFLAFFMIFIAVGLLVTFIWSETYQHLENKDKRR